VKPPATIAVRPAAPGDEEKIAALVRGLAEYEKLLDQAVATPAALGAALFCEQPRVFCDLAEVDGDPLGFALWFYSFSTFVGRHGIYLEDLFVEPRARGRGVGRALLKHLAQRCVAENLGRLEWTVLDWNEPAMAFYRAHGAQLLDDWTVCRVKGDALIGLAGEE
jgi:GNAT superfamily N-acetyltransferase